MEDPASVGIQGGVAPLSWPETYPMKGIDENEMFTAMMEINAEKAGAKSKWEDDPDHKVRIIITRQ